MINLDILIQEARKERNTIALGSYQNLKAEIQKYETSKGAKPMSDSIQLGIFNKYAKQLEDSIEQFKNGGRTDLVESTLLELNVVKELLPAPVSGDEIVEYIYRDPYFKCYEHFDYPSRFMMIPKREMGTCIKYLKEKFPTADGKDISNIIKAMVFD